jgi:hypothetical protein
VGEVIEIDGGSRRDVSAADAVSDRDVQVRLCGRMYAAMRTGTLFAKRFDRSDHLFAVTLVIRAPSRHVPVAVTGWYLTKRSMHCCHFLICCASPYVF